MIGNNGCPVASRGTYKIAQAKKKLLFGKADMFGEELNSINSAKRSSRLFRTLLNVTILNDAIDVGGNGKEDFLMSSCRYMIVKVAKLQCLSTGTV